MGRRGYYLGRWIKRGRRWHLTQSKIADRYVTKCGREMRERLHGKRVEMRDEIPPDETGCHYCPPD